MSRFYGLVSPEASWRKASRVCRIGLDGGPSNQAGWLLSELVTSALATTGSYSLSRVSLHENVVPDVDIVVLTCDSAEGAMRLVASLRGCGAGMPIVIVSPAAEGGRTAGLLNSGADDVVPAPFDNADLLARVWRFARPIVQPPDAARVLVNPNTFSARVDGVEAKFQEVSYKVFTRLVAHADRWVRSAELSTVWDTTFSQGRVEPAMAHQGNPTRARNAAAVRPWRRQTRLHVQPLCLRREALRLRSSEQVRNEAARAHASGGMTCDP